MRVHSHAAAAVCLCFICLGAPRVTSAVACSRFDGALISGHGSPDLPKAARAVFGWLIGNWNAVVYDYGPHGTRRVSHGEWHFSWVLEGRAIQDVWIVPRVPQRRPSMPTTDNRYGTTLRVYDDKIKAWRVFWFNPVTGDRSSLVARRVGNSVIQQGLDDDGSFIRWTFEHIRANSFVWRGDYSYDGGATWHRDAKFIARRARTANEHPARCSPQAAR